MKNKNQQLSSVQSLMQQRQLSSISVNKWCSNINHVIQVTVESTLILQNKPNKTNSIFRTIYNKLLPQNSSTNSKLRWHFLQRILNSIWVLKFIQTLSIHQKVMHHLSYNKSSKNYMKCKSNKNGNNTSCSSNNIKSLTLKPKKAQGRKIVVLFLLAVLLLRTFNKTNMISFKEIKYFIRNHQHNKNLILTKSI